ncbi:MAG: beta-propeller domain-containing protein [Bdellovibrionaceae bacterium]|nr:beta-propeller domain-containing protein [Pseudobdellovibrionaceae bacterium]
MKPLLQTLLSLSALYLIGCGGFGGSDNSNQGVFTTEILKFSNCAELRATANAASTMYMNVMPISADAAIPVSGSAPNTQIYDNQSSSVLESDRVLANRHNLFVLRKNSLEVFSRGSFQRSQIVMLESSNKNTLFVDDQYVIVIASSDYLTTKVSIYDATSLLLRKEYVLEGLFDDVRRHGDQLIVMANSYSYLSIASEETINPNQTIVSPNCNEIYQSQTNIYTSGLTLLYNIQLDDFSKVPSSTGFAGYTNLIYMSANALYLASNSYYTFPSHIRQIKWTSDSISLNSVATYNGAIKDRWAMNEYADNDGIKLAIATTISETSVMPAANTVTNILPANTNQINHLLVFSERNGKLTQTAESNPFGANESIQSVRFVGDLAYVVTFRITDPLFIFDLSNRNNIQQLGELKVPGFSTHLRPLMNHHMLGVGYDTQDSQGTARQAGVQISLFDVGQSNNPIRKNVFSYGVRGSYSDATIDSHALLYDSGTGLIGLPVVELTNPYANDRFSWGTTVGFAGAQIYRYASGQLTELGRISHSKWRTQYNCGSMLYNGWSYGSSDINRIIMLDDKLITISQFGLMTHNPQTLATISEQMFTARPSGFCYEPGLQW